MPTLNAEGTSKEVYISDALPAGTAEIGRTQRIRDAASGVTLIDEALLGSSGTGEEVTDATVEQSTTLILVMDVTAQSGTTPTLDAVVQVKFGATYVNLARFSQYGAATGAKAIVVHRDLSFATEIVPAADPAVGSGLLINNHDWGSVLRVKYTIAGTSPQYNFSVIAHPIR